MSSDSISDKELKEFARAYDEYGNADEVYRNFPDRWPVREEVRAMAREARERGFITSRPRTPSPLDPSRFVELYRQYGSLKSVFRNTEHSYRECQRAYREAFSKGEIEALSVGGKTKEALAGKPEHNSIEQPSGRVKAPEVQELPLPPKGKVYRYLFTSAQNDTPVFEALWRNLNVLADFYNASIHVARFTYHRHGMSARGDKAAVGGTDKRESFAQGEEMTWEPRLVSHFSDDRIRVAPGLDWCGEMNILPTAVRPLSGLGTYTGRRSSIFPHVKVAMESVASNKMEPTKFVYTTGTVTKRNYIHKKAGLKAEEHHTYGAMLVEVESDGSWFARQIIADENGTLNDLDVRVSGASVSTGQRVQAIYWGDPHVVEADPVPIELAFGEGQMKDSLQPREEFMGDVISFRGRSHHDMKDPYRVFAHYQRGLEDVEKEVTQVGRFLECVARPWCKTRIVYGNHEMHMGRWLKEQDGRNDPVNAEFWARMQRAVYAALAENPEEEPHFLKTALYEVGNDFVADQLDWIGLDESRVVLRDKDGGIECGMHGDVGPKGTRGTPQNLAKTGRALVIGDKHAAEIVDQCWVAGTFAKQDVGWNRGPSNWSWSHVIIHTNGTRQMVTMWGNSWAAGRGIE